MKKIFTQHFTGYYSDTAIKRFDKFIKENQKEYTTFEIISIAMSQVRAYDQEITIVYSIDQLDLDLKELKEEYNNRCEYLHRFIKEKKRFSKKDFIGMLDMFQSMVMTYEENDHL